MDLGLPSLMLVSLMQCTNHMQQSSPLRTPPQDIGKHRALQYVPMNISDVACSGPISGTLSSPKELTCCANGARIDWSLFVTIHNRTQDTASFPWRNALKIVLHRADRQVVPFTYARDHSIRVPRLTSEILPGASYRFVRLGQLNAQSVGRRSITLVDESGGVTTYSNLIPASYFFTATYEAGGHRGKATVLQMSGRSFLIH